MDILGKLFGGAGRVKLMRLFVTSPEETFLPKDISLKIKESISFIEKELEVLKKIKLVNVKKVVFPPVGKKKGGKAEGFCLNGDFVFLRELRELLLGSELLNNDELVKRIRSSGRVKLIIVAGIFLRDEDSRADLLIVGDSLNKNRLAKIVKKIEADLGKELNYGVFDTADYRYRLNVSDRFVRDILDFPHVRILDKLSE